VGRLIGKLKALTVARVKEPGRYGDGGGLYLQVTSSGARSWLFRYWVEDRDPESGQPVRDETGKACGKSREMGLGSCVVVSLEQARELAGECRKLRRQGIDPIEARRATKTEAALHAAKSISFAKCAEDFIKAHRPGWSNEKHAYQWQASIRMFVDPIIGALPFQAIDTNLVLKVLESIWTEKPETASRVRGRIESILDWAKVKGYRAGENSARWRGHLDKLLPAPSKVRKIVHYPALPFAELPNFMVALRTHESIAATALQFTILTAARTGEVLGARWSEINLAEKIWTVPADRMKSSKEHRVPLGAAALAILRDMNSLRDSDSDALIFPGRNGGRLTALSMLRILARMQRDDLTVHGFRSSFRDWAAERTNFPNQVVEMALAHAIGDKVEAAYRRGDLFDKRRRLMDEWAKFCASSLASGAVVPLRSMM
jgi:integrase